MKVVKKKILTKKGVNKDFEKNNKIFCYVNEASQCQCSFNGCVAQCHC